MGFSLKRFGAAVGTLGLSEVSGQYDKLFGPRAQMLGQVDRRGVSEIQWDPKTGMPIGLTGAVDPRNALAYQQHANELTATRNQGRRNDAAAFLEQATTQSQTFRPGGYAAMGAGLWSQRAQLAFGDQIEAPDLLAGYRERKSVDAANAQRRAAKMNFASGLLTAGIPLLGGGGAAAPAALAAKTSPGGGTASSMGAPEGGGYSDSPGMAESGGGGMAGGGMGGGFDPYAYANRAETAYGSTEFGDAYSAYTKNRMRTI